MADKGPDNHSLLADSDLCFLEMRGVQTMTNGPRRLSGLLDAFVQQELGKKV